MAIIQTDEINNLHKYFEPMDISDKEKKNRVALAEELMDIFLFLFDEVLTAKELKKEISSQDISDKYIGKYTKAVKRYLGHIDYDPYANTDNNPDTPTIDTESLVDGNTEMSEYIQESTQEIIKTTIERDADFYTSRDRAFNNAVDGTNTVGAIAFDNIAIAEGKKTKTWITMKDSKVRKSHKDVDEETVLISDYFDINGYQARYPNDPNLPIEERMGCRCVCEYS